MGSSENDMNFGLEEPAMAIVGQRDGYRSRVVSMVCWFFFIRKRQITECMLVTGAYRRSRPFYGRGDGNLSV